MLLDTKLLRQKVLDLAISGQLVPQLDSEPAVEQLGKAPEDVPFEIPKKWKWVKLDFLAEYIQRGKSPSYSDIKSIPVISQKCNQWDGFHIEPAKFISPDTLVNYKQERFVQDHDLLWNSTGLGTIGRVALYKSELNPYKIAVVDSHVTIVRSNQEQLNPLFLYHYLSSASVQNSIEDLSTGSTKQKELSLSTIKALLIPQPPLEEQKRIVAKVEEIFAELDAIDKAYSELEQLGTLSKSKILDLAIKGQLVPQLDSEPAVEQLGKAPEDVPFEIPKKWTFVKLSNISVKVHYGYTASATDNGNYKLLRITDISSGYVNWDTVPFCHVDEKAISKMKLAQNDLVIARSGASVGSAYLIKELKCDAVFASYLIRVIPKIDLVYPKYLEIFCNSPFYWRQIQKSSTGTAQLNVNAKALNNLDLPLPPLEEQKRIVAKVEELFALIDAMKK